MGIDGWVMRLDGGWSLGMDRIFNHRYTDAAKVIDLTILLIMQTRRM